MTAARPSHVLSVESADEYEFRHPDDCPRIDLGGHWDYDCLLGRIVHSEGFDADDLAPGEYAATAGAGQDTIGEWQGGIDLVRLNPAPDHDSADCAPCRIPAAHPQLRCDGPI